MAKQKDQAIQKAEVKKAPAAPSAPVAESWEGGARCKRCGGDSVAYRSDMKKGIRYRMCKLVVCGKRWVERRVSSQAGAVPGRVGPG